MDDWGETGVTSQQTDFYNDDGGGRSYGKGRGFAVQSNDADDGYGNHNNDDDFGGGRRPGRGGGRGGGRGNRGRGGGRGGYRNRQDDDDSYKTGNDYGYDNDGDDGGGFKPSNGGRESNFRNKNYDDENGDGENGGFGGSRGRGGRGGRGRGRSDRGDSYGRSGGYGDGDESRNERGDRGRGRDGGNGDNGDNEESDKPKEIYIPPEFPTDEKSLFETGVSQGINFDKYDKIEVRVTGENPPEPIHKFEQAGLRNIVLENIMKSEYTKPTPVQKYALPIIMGGRDLMACAQTGSGKTAAFAVPIIHTLLDKPTDLVVSSSHCEPQVIIVSPTRELTIQIYRQIMKFALNSILKTVVAYGGTSVIHQGGKLSAGCHILVATPGRLMDFVERGRITFASVRFLVLDEADRMLDMGFLPSIEKMVDHVTMVPLQERQTLMFSATFPDDVQRLAGRFLNNYIFLAVGIVGGACSDVEQNFYEVAKYKKKDMLKEILERENDKGTLSGTLVFVEMKKKADFIAVFLSENNYPTTSIHGDRLQRQREEALADFKSGKMSILVATAVAARGLDIKNVSHVINYDMPKGIDEYVHRIGRTGRVGNKGRATSFFDPTDDIPLREDLVKILKQANQPVPDWLEAGGVTRSYAPGRGKQYGGEDVRDFNEGGDIYAEAATNPADAEPDEAW